MKRGLKLMVILFGAVSITALGIDAADTLTGSRTTLLGQLITLSRDTCPAGMIELPAATTFTCVDKYEVSASEDCPHPTPRSIFDTDENITNQACVGVSEAKRVPWRFVSRDEAEILCLRSGKRLPTNQEWQRFALGTTAELCNTHTDEVSETGAHAACMSAVGVVDAVGNVWEWTYDEVYAGVFKERPLPPTGYVQLADNSGMAVETTNEPSAQYGADYFWSGAGAVTAIMRGGFYGSAADAGVYAAHTNVTLDFTGEAIGFRCIQ